MINILIYKVLVPSFIIALTIVLVCFFLERKKDHMAKRLTGECPNCGYNINYFFVRDVIYSNWRRIFGLKYKAVICYACKKIIGWE